VIDLTSDREEIVEFLAAVPALNPMVWPPSVQAQGQAWPLLGRVETAGYGYGSVTWRVIVLAGADARTAEQFTDANLGLIVEALRPFMYVDTITPVALPEWAALEFAGRK
jgi:hypothetical protein